MLNCFGIPFRSHRRTSICNALLLVRSHVACVSKPRKTNPSPLKETEELILTIFMCFSWQGVLQERGHTLSVHLRCSSSKDAKRKIPQVSGERRHGHFVGKAAHSAYRLFFVFTRQTWKTTPPPNGQRAESSKGKEEFCS